METKYIIEKEKEFLLVLQSRRKNKILKKRALNNLVDYLVSTLANTTEPEMRTYIFNSIGKAATNGLNFGIKVDPFYEQLIPNNPIYK